MSSPCPESEARAAMSDAEFWELVLIGVQAMNEAEEPDLDFVQLDAGPCAECGETNACAYDAEGRPLIHTREVDSDD